ncbi:MAG: dTMP kinase [Candidatus Gastranaerophilales bacterium]|nr:dTMP kinase [Candidatus Gastranaerophilales bacterium]
MKKDGFFITFEGADGSGKTTQIKMLEEYLVTQKKDFIITRDPGGTKLGSKLREILLTYDGKIAPFCELFLYLADRAQHVDEVIMPALNNGKMVLCDRYIDSTLAYQGYARGLNIDEIINLNNLVTHSLIPDLTLLFDIETGIAMKRIGDKKDRLESEAAHFHEKVRFGYLDLAKKDPQRIKVIDASMSIDDVYNQVIEIIKQFV